MKNKKEILSQEISKFPVDLDIAVLNKFGVECKTEYSIFTGSYVSKFEASSRKEKEIRLFIEGFIAGNLDLSQRIFHIIN